MFKNIIAEIKNTTPLVHCITNYVTVNDCANILLACGGSPIMADDIREAADITSVCSALDINIGTLNKNTIESMFAAGAKANELGHPVILDPVGAGASKLRTETACELLEKIKFSIIRGNISEIKALTAGSSSTKGVDADAADAVTPDNLEKVIAFAKEFSAKTGAVIAITGATDIVADSEKAYVITNGHPIMSKITGSGCMLSAMLGAFAAAGKTNISEACAAAVCAMGLCGEIAFKRMKNGDGNLSFRTYLINAVYNLTDEKLKEGAKYEIR